MEIMIINSNSRSICREELKNTLSTDGSKEREVENIGLTYSE